MLLYRELHRGANEKGSLLLNGRDYAVWAHNGKTGVQTGGIFETEREARDWLNGNRADHRAQELATAEEHPRSCEQLQAQRLRMGYRLVDRVTHRC